jgi:hypothetical protein
MNFSITDVEELAAMAGFRVVKDLDSFGLVMWTLEYVGSTPGAEPAVLSSRIPIRIYDWLQGYLYASQARRSN